MSEKPNEDKIKASPAARRIAKELGIDLNDIPVSDQAERIQLEDVQQYHKFLLTQGAPDSQIPPSEPTDTPVPVEGEDADDGSEEDIIVFDMGEDTTEDSESEAPAVTPDTSVAENSPFSGDKTEEHDTAQNETPNEKSIYPNANKPKEGPADFHDDALTTGDAEDLAHSDTGCGEENSFMFLPPMPLSISFEVSDDNIRSMLTGLSIPLEDGLIPTVIKAAANAFKTTENMLYEGRMNLIEYEDGEFVTQTVTDAQSKKISEMDYDTDEDETEIPINIWDLSDFGFSKFQRTDTDQVNLFVMRKNDRILIDMTCDEYVMDITEATTFMHQLKKYLENLSYMLL